MTTAISVENVTFAYDEQPVIEDVSLSIKSGDFLGLIGPNGSGKTTLLKIMLGLEEPDSGTVELFETPAAEFRDGTRLGYVSQRATTADSMMPITVREVVRMGRYAHAGLWPLDDEDHEIIENALETVDISHLANRRISNLSGGQRQRAYIARALASEADLLALDEPTVGIDADSVERFYDLLDELNDDGITIILIEHDIGVLTKHVNSVACLNRELYHHGDTVSFLESNVLADAYGANTGILEHDHP